MRSCNFFLRLASSSPANAPLASLTNAASFAEKIAQVAMEAGVPKHMLQKLAAANNDIIKAALDAEEQATATRVEGALAKLRAEWGGQHDASMALAKRTGARLLVTWMSDGGKQAAGPRLDGGRAVGIRQRFGKLPDSCFAERLGYDGLSVPEAVHDGMLVALLCLEHTTRLRVATGAIVGLLSGGSLLRRALRQLAWCMARVPFRVRS